MKKLFSVCLLSLSLAWAPMVQATDSPSSSQNLAHSEVDAHPFNPTDGIEKEGLTPWKWVATRFGAVFIPSALVLSHDTSYSDAEWIAIASFAASMSAALMLWHRPYMNWLEHQGVLRYTVMQKTAQITEALRARGVISEHALKSLTKKFEQLQEDKSLRRLAGILNGRNTAGFKENPWYGQLGKDYMVQWAYIFLFVVFKAMVGTEKEIFNEALLRTVNDAFLTETPWYAVLSKVTYRTKEFLSQSSQPKVRENAKNISWIVSQSLVIGLSTVMSALVVAGLQDESWSQTGFHWMMLSGWTLFGGYWTVRGIRHAYHHPQDIPKKAGQFCRGVVGLLGRPRRT
jgi:hypothetical protein